MNSEQMMRMSPEELDAYARSMGFSVKGKKGVEEKAEAIRERRSRSVELTLLGVGVTVPVKRLHDKRVTDLLSKEGRTDAETEAMARLIVGDEARALLPEAAAEEGGTVDNDARGYAITAHDFSPRLKNY